MFDLIFAAIVIDNILIAKNSFVSNKRFARHSPVLLYSSNLELLSACHQFLKPIFCFHASDVIAFSPSFNDFTILVGKLILFLPVLYKCFISDILSTLYFFPVSFIFYFQSWSVIATSILFLLGANQK